MARPKKDQTAKTVTVRMIPEDWEALNQKAKSMGYRSRAELFRAIARGQVLGEDQGAGLLGESVPG